MTAIDTFADDLLLQMLTLRADLAAEMGVTSVGDRRLPQDTLPDFSDAGSAATDAMMADAAERLTRIVAPQSGEDAITHRVVRYVLEKGAFSFFRGRAGHRFVDTPYPVNHLNGFHPILLLMLSRDHSVRSADDAEAYLARLAQIPYVCAGVEDALKSRAAKGIIAPRFALVDSAADMKMFLATPPVQNVLVTSFGAKLADARIPNSERLVARAAKLLETEIYPAYARVIAGVEDLTARAGEERGFWSLPDGDAYYDWLFRASTTSDMSPAEAHDIGHAEIARVQAIIRDRFGALGIHGDSIAALYAQISDAPRFRYPQTPEGRAEVWSDATTLMRRFEGATLDLFRTRPRAALDLVEVPAALEETMHTHYTPPAVDGSRPGRFSLNIALAQGNPRWELATLCAHEGTPGHHLQLTIAQELPIASTFRRTVVFDAYIEGWAKYAETIPESHGLLDDPWAQLGRVRGELYSTVNLAMDTGIHAKRWSRDQARAFFRDNTGVSEDFAGVIADRGFVTPGQLCSYKVGMMNFLSARDRFRGRDIRDFHDCVLGHGALPLSVLDDVVTATLSGESAMIRNDTALATSDVKHLIHGFTNLTAHEANGPKIIVRGEGVRVFDEGGRDYIEAAGGMWCAALGFSEDALARAATEQLARLPYYHTLTSKSVDRAIELAEKLCAMVPIPDAKIYFAVTGSEGNDYVVKFLWAYNNVIGRPQKKKVISRWGAYHGATIGATSLTGLARNHALFDAPLDRFLHVGNMHHYMEAHDGESVEEFAARRAEELEAEILRQGPDTVMAFMAEPVMGGGGVILPPADYYARVQKVLKKYDIMFLADEVITGFGRTGNMFGCETFDIAPDTMVLGKGITAAYQPLAAVVLSDQIYQGLRQVSDQVGSFAHGATYSGHPVAVAVGLKTIELMEQRGILANVRASGAYLRERLDALRDWPFVGEVRGVGLVAAIQFVQDKKTRRLFDPAGSFASRLQAKGEDHGIITRLSANDTIAFAPPLTITRAEVGEMMDRFEKALKDVIAATPK